ncbi:MAG: flippase [Acidobacteria bacterium]|nr:flippase [Acidobacteriota bacterium]
MSQAPSGAAVDDSQRLARNYLFLSAGEFGAKLLAFTAFTFLGRVLGPERYGSLEFALAVMVFFTLPVDFGLGDYGAREVAKNRARAAEFLRSICSLRLLLALGSFITLLLFVLVIRKSFEVKLLLILFGLNLFAAPLLLQWFFQGHDRMHWVAMASITRLGVFALLVFLFVRVETRLYYVGLMECASVAAVATLCLYILRRRLGFGVPRPSLKVRPLTAHFREAAPIGLSELSWAFLWYFATVLLGFVAPGPSLGWFGAAHRAVMALHTFVWLYFFNLLPSLSRSVALPREHLLNLLHHSLAIGAWGGIFVALLMTTLSRELLRMAYGPRFAEAAPLFSVLVWMIPVALLSGHYRYTLIAYGLQNWLLYCTAIAAGVAVALCFLLVSRYGALGAASSLLTALLVNFALAYAVVQRRVARIHFGAQLIRPLTAMAASLVLFAVLRAGNAWIAGFAAALAYLLLLVIWQRQELIQLSLILTRKGPWFAAGGPQVK